MRAVGIVAFIGSLLIAIGETRADIQGQSANACDNVLSLEDSFPLTGFCQVPDFGNDPYGSNKSQKSCEEWAKGMHTLYLGYYKHIQTGLAPSSFRHPLVTGAFDEAIANLQNLITVNARAPVGQCPTRHDAAFPLSAENCKTYVSALQRLKDRLIEDRAQRPTLGQLQRLMATYRNLLSPRNGVDSRKDQELDRLLTTADLSGSNARDVNLDLRLENRDRRAPRIALPSSHGDGTPSAQEFNAISAVPLAPLGLIVSPEYADGDFMDHLVFIFHDRGHGDRRLGRQDLVDSFRCGCQVDLALQKSRSVQKAQISEAWFLLSHEMSASFSSRSELLASVATLNTEEIRRGVPSPGGGAIAKIAESLSESCFSSKEREEEAEQVKAAARATQSAAVASAECGNDDRISIRTPGAVVALALRSKIRAELENLTEIQKREAIQRAIKALQTSFPETAQTLAIAAAATDEDGGGPTQANRIAQGAITGASFLARNVGRKMIGAFSLAIPARIAPAYASSESIGRFASPQGAAEFASEDAFAAQQTSMFVPLQKYFILLEMELAAGAR